MATARGRVLVSLWICLGFAGCATTSGTGFDLADYRLVDLTYTFDSTTIYWPTFKAGFETKTISWGRTLAGYFNASKSICAPEHGGTHMDAPVHFSETGDTSEKIPLTRLAGRAVVIDVSAQAAKDPDYRLEPKDIELWERRNGRIPEGAIVFLRTGWGRRWPDRKKYLGDDTPGSSANLHFPAFGKEAAELLVAGRGAVSLGVDTASVDHGPSRDFIVHQVVQGANVPVFENVANLEKLPEAGAWVFALPMKIGGGTGGPVRIVALVP